MLRHLSYIKIAFLIYSQDKIDSVRCSGDRACSVCRSGEAVEGSRRQKAAKEGNEGKTRGVGNLTLTESTAINGRSSVDDRTKGQVAANDPSTRQLDAEQAPFPRTPRGDVATSRTTGNDVANTRRDLAPANASFASPLRR
jgi:hypothetical protein